MTLIINMDEGKKICEVKGCDGGGFALLRTNDDHKCGDI